MECDESVLRINEAEAAAAFIEKLAKGYYPFERSVNTEVVYHKEKEQRDTDAVKAFITSELFQHLIALR